LFRLRLVSLVMKRLCPMLGVVFALFVLGGSHRPTATSSGASGRTEVVVALSAPPLARAPRGSARIDAQQRMFRSALELRLPDARVRWRYRLVQNGFAVTLPQREVSLLRDLPGVRQIYASAPYGPQLDQSPEQIGAPAVWGPGLETAGEGVKIGIIDSGVDPSHPFFDPTGYAMPAGFPKGQRGFTTAKVIVARSFPPPGAKPRAKLAFSSGDASHGTHVAGIAAGNSGTRASGGRVVSGVAPKAYIGSYKVFVPTVSGISPNANSPEIVAAVEAAVSDGMDVINFSGGEDEIEPSRDIVALALDAAAAAGVVPVVAAGNEYNDAGAGSVSSPGNSAKAITVGAVEANGIPPTSVHAEFSSVGPTPISLRLKPDVVAPGVDILSSVPGGWSSISGTSMASPHVAGAAALLRQRHPDWTVADIKSALVETGVGVRLEENSVRLAGPAYAGGGLISLPQADQPLVFAEPSELSWGLQRPGSDVTSSLQLADAGGGAGTWQVSVDDWTELPGSRVVVPDTVDVPGQLSVELSVSDLGLQGDASGFVTLRRGADVRHIPFWGRVAAPALGRHRALPLTQTGIHSGTTRGQPAYVSRYRYPEDPRGLGVHTQLGGPEIVYRIRIAKMVANFGVVITKQEDKSAIEPRVVSQLDENRLTGFAALPVVENPYLPEYGARVLAAAALSPRPGEYGIVFDSPRASGAGKFTFRYWVNDVTPPTVRLRTRSVQRGDPVRLRVTDAGSGVYPSSISAQFDGETVEHRYASGRLRIPTAGLAPGTHRLRIRVSDYQETHNIENVARILPNTRFFRTTFRVR
jgi:subtilisin family serine protease